MWSLQITDEYAARVKRFEKKHDRELIAVLINLDQYHKALNEGAKPLQVHFGFMHTEPMGVIAIDQKGGGKSLMQTRLYVYPEVEHRVLHLITLGDKNTQRLDIAFCREYASSLRTVRQNNEHKPQDAHEVGRRKRNAGINPPHFGRVPSSEATGAETSQTRTNNETGGTTGSQGLSPK